MRSAGLNGCETKTLKVVDPLQHKLAEHVIYTRENLVGMREITKWHWTDGFRDPVASSADRPNDFTDIYERVSRSINGPPSRVTALAPLLRLLMRSTRIGEST
jgi:uncharacterized protein YfkK (UPF0435 family)